MIYIRSEKEIASIKEAGEIVRRVLEELKNIAKDGIKTIDLANIAEDIIVKEKGVPAFKGYRGFPGAICTSINEEVVHGIPSRRRLEEGDILSIDAGVRKNGFYADSAISFIVGRAKSPKDVKLLEVTKKSLELGIEEAREGNRLFDISNAIQSYVEDKGFSIVRDFVGHGIGEKLHEDPEIPNFGKPSTGPRLKEGMILAIEPMVNSGGYEVKVLNDGWTAVTKDRKLSAHFEHTICVTKEKAKILT